MERTAASERERSLPGTPPEGQAAGTATAAGFNQAAKLAADDGDADDEFGPSVAVSDDGTTAVIGANEDEDPSSLAGSAYVFSSSTNSGTVTLPGASNPAQDPDGDGRYEDVTGDGKRDIADVLTYYNHRNSDAIRNNPTVFDLDGDGTSGTVFDALELYNEIS